MGCDAPLLLLLAHAVGEPFVRGEGMYIHPLKLLVVVALFFAWVRTCTWIDADASRLLIPRTTWNLFSVGSGLAAFFLVFLVPIFALSLLLVIVLYLVPVLLYVYLRNRTVEPNERVLTAAHIRRLLNGKSAESDGASKKKRKANGQPGDATGETDDDESAANDLPVRFIGKGMLPGEEDSSIVEKASKSKGYRHAMNLVLEAVRGRATDIHLEPTRDELLVRFRIDSMLHTTPAFSRQRGDSVLNIFKVLAALDITEKRRAQDGSFSAVIEGRNIDFRVATAGGVTGEKMVMRILDRSKQVTSLDKLGMSEGMRNLIRQIIDRPYGMLIACGPTGAGKSSTLYACLAEIDRSVRNVITLENPVEYVLDSITQIEINVKAGKTFANELRSILRQDPDVILVGEVRDAETAEIACQASQTGHVVFTTLHANDSVTAIARLIDLGVQPFLVANSISGILSQRLVRLLCPKCKVKYKPSNEELEALGMKPERVKFLCRPPEPGEIATDEDGQPIPCAHCGGMGYFGRSGIFELLVVNDAIRSLIRSNPDMVAIKEEAIKNGLLTLWEDGLMKVLSGKTSLAEVTRVAR